MVLLNVGPGSTMPTFASRFLAEFDQEMVPTRRVLERVPADKGDWKPHPRSFSLAHLAQLVSWMPGWFSAMIDDPHIDLGASAGYSNESTETLLAGFDRAVARSRAAIERLNEEKLAESWSLKHGEHVLMTSSRDVALRSTMNHLAHHRGQLSVYLRLLDVPVPSIYGPSADEKGF